MFHSVAEASGFSTFASVDFHSHISMWCDVYVQWFTNTRAHLQPLATTNNKLGGCVSLTVLARWMIFHIFLLWKLWLWREMHSLSGSCVSKACKKARNRFYTHRKETEPSSKRTTSRFPFTWMGYLSLYPIFLSLSHYHLYFSTTDLTPPLVTMICGAFGS